MSAGAGTASCLSPSPAAARLVAGGQFAVTLARHGFHVLLFDPRCYGLSGCPSQAAASLVADDTAAAVALLRERGSGSVEVVGASLGGSAALVATAHDRHIAAVADLRGDENTTSMATRAGRTATAAARAIHQPTLIAIARGDPYVTVTAERTIASRLATPHKQLLIEPADAGHGWDMLGNGTTSSRLVRTLIDFLRTHAR